LGSTAGTQLEFRLAIGTSQVLVRIAHHNLMQQSIQVVPLLAFRAGYVEYFGHVVESPYSVGLAAPEVR
jgi:hypothetical protein